MATLPFSSNIQRSRGSDPVNIARGAFGIQIQDRSLEGCN